MRIFLLLLTVVPTLAWADVDGIINRALTLRTIKREDVQSLYLLKERFGPEGARPRLHRLPLDSRLHREFVRDVLRMSPDQFDREWKRLVSLGLATEIEEVRSEKEMLAAVSRKPMGAGYISKDYVVLNLAGSDAVVVRVVD